MKNFVFPFAALFAAAALSSCCNNHGNTGIEGVMTVKLDNAEVIWIKDNAEPRLMERSLFPDASDSLLQSLGLENGIPASMSTFLVRKDGKLLLFDTGLGAENSRLAISLDSLGIDAGDIDFIFLTHLHGDHTGGMLADGIPRFPKAEVYVSETEYNGWTAMPEKQKLSAIGPLEAYGDRLHLFSEEDSLPCGVKQIPAYGHTPGHTVYQTGNLLIVGDIMHGATLQSAHPEICADFDMDKPAAIESRVKTLDYARKNSLVMAGMHFPEPAFIFPSGETD